MGELATKPIESQSDSAGGKVPSLPPPSNPVQLPPGTAINLSELDDDSPSPEPVAAPAPAPAAAPAATPTPTAGDTNIEFPTFVVPPDDASVPAPEPTPAPAPAPAATPAPVVIKHKRDYSNIPPELVEILSELPNSKYDNARVRLLAMHEARAKADETQKKLDELSKPFEMHERAYLLDPQYEQALTRYNAIDFETRHYQQQLMSVKNGDSWYEIQGYDAKTGQPLFVEHKAPASGAVDTESEIKLTQHLSNLGMALARTREEANGIVTNYGTTYQQSVREIGEMNKRLFPDFHEVAKRTPQEVERMNMVKQALPPRLRTSPLAETLGLAMVGFQRLLMKHAQTLGELNKLRTQVASMQTVANPNALPAIPTIPTGGVVKFDELED